MFILTTLKDTIRIEPAELARRTRDVIEDNVNNKYANKVIHQVGLCLCFYDLLSAKDGLISHGDGCANVNVEFRLLVFRPFRGEIIEGKVAESTAKGIRITLDFFDDVFVPCPANIFDNARYDAIESHWIWQSEDGDDYHFDRYEKVRLRVEDEVWLDQRPYDAERGRLVVPPGPVNPSAAANASASGDAVAAVGERAEGTEDGLGRSPWRILGSMSESGLGQPRWW